MHINPIERALGGVTLGPEIVFQNLTMIPLLNLEPNTVAGSEPLSYSTLDDALKSELTEVREISEHGSVPELRVLNRAKTPVLIVDGEELVGAKQNRVVNLSILVPAETELIIPVSCVEAGRWRAKSRKFSSAPRTQYASGRAKRIAQVTASLRDRGDYSSDQAEVWSDIAAKSERLRSHSPTSAMEAMYVDHSQTIDRYVQECQPVPRQVGALFAVGGTLVGFDLFDRPATLKKVLPKLVRSVAVDAIDHAAQADAAFSPISVRPLARLFVAAVGAAPTHQAKAVGLGEDVRLSAPGLTGAALVAEGTVVHMSAFQM
jgi:hypothetical protein